MARSLEVAFNWALDMNATAEDQGDALTYGESIEIIEELHTYALDRGMTREEVHRVYQRAWLSPSPPPVEDE